MHTAKPPGLSASLLLVALVAVGAAFVEGAGVYWQQVTRLPNGEYDCGTACAALGQSTGRQLRLLNGGNPGHPHGACRTFDFGQTIIGTKEESTGDSCNYASATGKLYSGAPPSYDCACIQEGSVGLTWQQSACTAGSEPVSAPNICLVEKEDGTNLAMGWLDGATQTCAFPRNFSWAPTGLWTGFGGRLKMSQLCYSAGCTFRHGTVVRCATTGETFFTDYGKLRRYPSSHVYDSYGNPPVEYTDYGSCTKVLACPMGDPMPFKEASCGDCVNTPAGTRYLQSAGSTVYQEACSTSPSTGTLQQCEQFAYTGIKKASACGGRIVCYAQVQRGGQTHWVPSHVCGSPSTSTISDTACTSFNPGTVTLVPMLMGNYDYSCETTCLARGLQPIKAGEFRKSVCVMDSAAPVRIGHNTDWFCEYTDGTRNDYIRADGTMGNFKCACKGPDAPMSWQPSLGCVSGSTAVLKSPAACKVTVNSKTVIGWITSDTCYFSLRPWGNNALKSTTGVGGPYNMQVLCNTPHCTVAECGDSTPGFRVVKKPLVAQTKLCYDEGDTNSYAQCQEVWYTGRKRRSSCLEQVCYAELEYFYQDKTTFFWAPSHQCGSTAFNFDDDLGYKGAGCVEPGAYCSARDLNFEWANGHLSAYYGNKHSSLKSYAECCAACYNDPLCKAFTHYAKNSTCYFMDDGASTRAYSPGAQSGQLTQLKPAPDCSTGNTYCIYCGMNAWRSTCLAPGSTPCTLRYQSPSRPKTEPLKLCSATAGDRGAADASKGNCPSFITSDSGVRYHLLRAPSSPPTDDGVATCTAACTAASGFTFHQGRAVDGGNAGQQVQGKSTAELADLCRARPECKAFMSNGWLKSTLLPSSYWTSGEQGVCSGLFVKDGAVFDEPGSQIALTCWGYNEYGQTTVPGGLADAVQVACGVWHTCALKSSGTVTCWGLNQAGVTDVPSGLTGVVQVAAGGYHNCALKNNGAVSCWGSDGYGQSTLRSGLSGVVQVAAGSQHTCVLKSDGTVECWGENSANQRRVPSGLSGVVQLAAGSNHNCAVKSGGAVECWGANDRGQSSVPSGLSGVVQVAAGDFHTCALKSSGAVECWGDNSYGQSTVPNGLSGVGQVTAGYSHNCALMSGGDITCWGRSGSGRTAVPSGLSDVVQVEAGNAHTCAIRNSAPACAQVSGNRYCVNCAANGDRQTCLTAGSQRCSVGTVTLQYCSSLNQQGSSPDGACPLYIAPGGGARLVHRTPLTTAPKPEPQETNPAAKCPAACNDSNRYCVHCSAARERKTCIAAGGQAGMSSYQDGGTTYPVELQLCTSLSAKTPDGVCHTTIAYGSPPVTFTLQPAGKGVALAAAQSYDCSACKTVRATGCTSGPIVTTACCSGQGLTCVIPSGRITGTCTKPPDLVAAPVSNVDVLVSFGVVTATVQLASAPVLYNNGGAATHYKTSLLVPGSTTPLYTVETPVAATVKFQEGATTLLNGGKLPAGGLCARVLKVQFAASNGAGYSAPVTTTATFTMPACSGCPTCKSTAAPTFGGFRQVINLQAGAKLPVLEAACGTAKAVDSVTQCMWVRWTGQRGPSSCGENKPDNKPCYVEVDLLTGRKGWLKLANPCTNATTFLGEPRAGQTNHDQCIAAACPAGGIQVNGYRFLPNVDAPQQAKGPQMDIGQTAPGTPAQLAAYCSANPACLGFTPWRLEWRSPADAGWTSRSEGGWLKRAIPTAGLLTKWGTSGDCRGLYVKDCPPTPTGFQFYSGYTLPSTANLRRVSSTTVATLAAECAADRSCLAFTTDGWLRKALPSRKAWVDWPALKPCEGLYVREAAAGASCDGSNSAAVPPGYVFFKNQDLLPDAKLGTMDLPNGFMAKSLLAVAAACDERPECKGFVRYADDNACLKGIVLPRERWRVQTAGNTQPCQGLFLKDWVRLVGGPFDNGGRVEMLSRNSWAAITNTRFGDQDAAVVCRHLGFTGGYAASVPNGNGPSSNDAAWATSMECAGTEPWLSECTTKWPGGLPVPDYGLPGPALAAVACYHSNEDRDSACPSIPGYSFVKGKGSNGNDQQTKYPGKSADEMASLCSASPTCKAFTTNGLLKTALKSPLDDWPAGACDGIYIRGPEWRLQPPFQLGAAQMPPPGSAGRLEVKYGGIWGTACWDNYEDSRVAATACRHLGFTGGRPELTYNYAGGVGVIWRRNIQCTGAEARLDACQQDDGSLYGGIELAGYSCSHSQDVGINCNPGSPGTEGQVRWRDTNAVRRLEVFHSGFWGAICSAGWDHRDACTWCRAQSNINSYGKASAVYGADRSLAWLSGVDCSGSEASLGACSKPDWGVPSCSGWYAGTQCLTEDQMCSPACDTTSCFTCNAEANLLVPACTRPKKVDAPCGAGGRGNCTASGLCQYGCSDCAGECRSCDTATGICSPKINTMCQGGAGFCDSNGNCNTDKGVANFCPVVSCSAKADCMGCVGTGLTAIADRLSANSMTTSSGDDMASSLSVASVAAAVLEVLDTAICDLTISGGNITNFKPEVFKFLSIHPYGKAVSTAMEGLKWITNLPVTKDHQYLVIPVIPHTLTALLPPKSAPLKVSLDKTTKVVAKMEFAAAVNWCTHEYLFAFKGFKLDIPLEFVTLTLTLDALGLAPFTPWIKADLPGVKMATTFWSPYGASSLPTDFGGNVYVAATATVAPIWSNNAVPEWAKWVDIGVTVIGKVLVRYTPPYMVLLYGAVTATAKIKIPGQDSIPLPVHKLGLQSSSGFYYDAKVVLWYIKLQQPDPVGFLLELANTVSGRKGLLPDPARLAVKTFLSQPEVYKSRVGEKTMSIKFFYGKEGWGLRLEPQPQMDIRPLSQAMDNSVPPYISALTLSTNGDHTMFKYEGTFKPDTDPAARMSKTNMIFCLKDDECPNNQGAHAYEGWQRYCMLLFPVGPGVCTLTTNTNPLIDRILCYGLKVANNCNFVVTCDGSVPCPVKV